MVMKTYPVHRYAKILPLADGPQMWELREDIRANGLVDAITVWQDAKGNWWILDGRRREIICRALEIEPRFETFIGSEAEAKRFVFSKNVARRHLTDTERAMAAADLANLDDGQKKSASPDGEGTTREEAAEIFNVSPRAVDRAKKIKHDGIPELQEAVKDETFSLSAGADLAAKPAEEQKAAVEQARKIDSNGTIYIFSWKRLDEPLGRLIRATDEAAEAHGKCSHFDKLMDLLRQATDTIEIWKKESNVG